MHLEQSMLQLQRFAESSGEDTPRVCASTLQQPRRVGIIVTVVHAVDNKMLRQMPCNVFAIMRETYIHTQRVPPKAAVLLGCQMRGTAAVSWSQIVRINHETATIISISMF
jgi:hypothetical protein